MRIIVFAITHNCIDTLPFFLRHYSTFANEIAVWDDRSTDGTNEMLHRHPKVVLRDWPYKTGIDEDRFLNHWQQWYPLACGAFDWVMIVDPDEFIYCPDIRKELEREMAKGVEVIRPVGFNMTGNGLPKDDGRQIWEIAQMGVHAPVYSKPVVFQPHIKINWIRGKHDLENCNPVIGVNSRPWLKLLHYRYMGADYTRAKNAKNYARCGLLSGDKGAAWSCSPGYDGPDKEHSPQWAEFAKTKAFNVIEA
jgi:hypothetical protein